MKKFAIIGARKPLRANCIAIMGAALLGSIAAAAPAQSADLYPNEYTAYPGYTGYSGYNGYRSCYSCGCSHCCQPCCRPCGVVRHVPVPVVERHWDYWERRYLVGGAYPSHHPYYPSGYAAYPYYPSYPDGYAGYGGPRPHLGYGGVQYPPYPPSPISYQYEAPRPTYEYGVPPSYDYEALARPPAGIPGAYYNAGYAE